MIPLPTTYDLYSTGSSADVRSRLAAVVSDVEDFSIAVADLADETESRLERTGLSWGGKAAFMTYIEKAVTLRTLQGIVRASGLAAYEREIMLNEVDRLFVSRRPQAPQKPQTQQMVTVPNGPAVAGLLPHIPVAGRNLLTGNTSHGIAVRKRS